MTLLFQWKITPKIFKFNIYENFGIPGAVSCESVLLKVFLNSMILFWLRAEIVQYTKEVRSHITLGSLAVEILPLKKCSGEEEGEGVVLKFKNCVIYCSKIA
jgi:hypothetical protein